MNKKKTIIITICIGVTFVALSVLVCFRLFGGFNAKEYVNAVCMQMLKGDTEGAVKMTRGLSEEDAKKQQKEMLEHFVDNMIASGLSLEQEEKEKCVKTAEKIFSDFEYEVTDSKKVKDGEYQVTIQYKSSDVIQKLQALAKKENELAKEKVNKGEYRGTKAEIDAQMRKEFAKKLPEMLDEAYQTMENGKQETMALTVKKGENGLYTVDIGKFLIKIMGLTAKQD